METSQTHLASKKSVVLKCQFAMGLKFDDLENKGKKKTKQKQNRIVNENVNHIAICHHRK